MSIVLSKTLETRLRAKAQQEGADINALAETLLDMALEWEAQDHADAVKGIQRGLDDFAQGRVRPFREFAAEQRVKYNLPASVDETP